MIKILNKLGLYTRKQVKQQVIVCAINYLKCEGDENTHYQSIIRSKLIDGFSPDLKEMQSNKIAGEINYNAEWQTEKYIKL